MTTLRNAEHALSNISCKSHFLTDIPDITKEGIGEFTGFTWWWPNVLFSEYGT